MIKNNLIYHSPTTIVSLIILLLIAYKLKNTKFIILTCAITVLVINFFRNHNERINKNSMIIISPCEGKILKIKETENHYKIIVFLSIFDKHIQLMPINGMIVKQKYKKGTFNAAMLLKKSKHNERLETYIRTKVGIIKVVQIAGLIARTIKSFVKPRGRYAKGAPLGMIKFGSRVDITLPKDTVKLLVRENGSICLGAPLARVL